MPGMGLSMAPMLTQRLSLRLSLEMRLEQRLVQALSLRLNMSQCLSVEERQLLAKYKIMQCAADDPMRVRVHETNGKKVVMKKYHFNKRDAYLEAANIEKLRGMQIDCPRLVGIVDRGENIYLITEYENAVNLRSVLINPEALKKLYGFDDFSEKIFALGIYGLGKSISEMHKKGIRKNNLRPENILLKYNGGLLNAVHTGVANVEYSESEVKSEDAKSEINDFLSDIKKYINPEIYPLLEKLFMQGYRGEEMGSLEEYNEVMARLNYFNMGGIAKSKQEKEPELHEYYHQQQERIKRVRANIRTAILECETFNEDEIFEAATKEFKTAIDFSRTDTNTQALIFAVEGTKDKWEISYNDVAYRVLLPENFVYAAQNGENFDEKDTARIMREFKAKREGFTERCIGDSIKLGVPDLNQFRETFLDSIVEKAIEELPNWDIKSLGRYLREKRFKVQKSLLELSLERIAMKNSLAMVNTKLRRFLISYIEEFLTDPDAKLDLQKVLVQTKNERIKFAIRKLAEKMITARLEEIFFAMACDKSLPDFEEMEIRFGVDSEKLREMYAKAGGNFTDTQTGIERVLARTEESAPVAEPEAVLAAEVAPEPEHAPEPDMAAAADAEPTETHDTNEDYSGRIIGIIAERINVTDEEIADELGITSGQATQFIEQMMRRRGLNGEESRQVINLVNANNGIENAEISARLNLPEENLILILRKEILAGRLFTGGRLTDVATDEEKLTVLGNLLTKRIDITDQELARMIGTDAGRVDALIETIKQNQGLDQASLHRLQQIIQGRPGIEDEQISELSGLTVMQIHLLLRPEIMTGGLRVSRERQG
jgi:serine/threonine protein kinase